MLNYLLNLNQLSSVLLKFNNLWLGSNDGLLGKIIHLWEQMSYFQVPDDTLKLPEYYCLSGGQAPKTKLRIATIKKSKTKLTVKTDEMLIAAETMEYQFFNNGTR